MPPTLMQRKALALAPKVTASLSMFGSFCIIKATLTDKKREVLSYHRLLLGMSVFDIVSSFMMFLSTWPIPKGTPGVWQASGTTATCTAQGFFIMLTNATPYYNTSLALYYVLITKFNWKEENICKIEKYLHGFPVLTAVGTSLAGIPLKLFNNANLWCWMAPYPLNCKDSFRFGDAANCIRGDNAWIYRFAFTFGPIWLCIIVSMVCMLIVYHTVLKQEKAVDRFQSDNTISVRKQSKRVAWQAFWYIVAFYITWLPPTVARLLQTIPQTRGKFYFPVILALALLLPMQGFWNFLVYSRSRYLRYTRENPCAKATEAIGYAAFSKQIRRSTCAAESKSATSPSEMLSDSPIKTEAILQSEIPDFVPPTEEEQEYQT